MKTFQKISFFNASQKRLTLLSAFCVFSCLVGCTDDGSTAPAGIESKKGTAVSYAQQSDASSTNTSDNISLLTLEELLDANDVKLALAKAADEGNKPMLEYWQQELIKAAKEVNLSEQDLSLISGPQGLKYLEFQGMKTNYQSAFEEAFFDFQDVDAVYAAYPAFKNLHERSRELVIQRDELILKAAQELKASGYEGDALSEARKQWQNYMLNQQALEKQNSVNP